MVNDDDDAERGEGTELLTYEERQMKPEQSGSLQSQSRSANFIAILMGVVFWLLHSYTFVCLKSEQQLVIKVL